MSDSKQQPEKKAGDERIKDLPSTGIDSEEADSVRGGLGPVDAKRPPLPAGPVDGIIKP